MSVPLFNRCLTESCRHFFGLTDDQLYSDQQYQVDDYWKVTPHQILVAVFNLFEKERETCLGGIQVNFIWEKSNLLYNEVTKSGSEPTKLAGAKEEKDEKVTGGKGEEGRTLIGICGEMRHGKTTICDMLKAHYEFTEYAFAHPLKEGCKVLFSLSDEQVYGDMKEVVDIRWGATPRYILQQVGTDMFREKLKIYLSEIHVESTLWIANFLRWFRQNPQYSNVAVSDVRFKDEAQVIKSTGGKLIKVIRPSLMKKSGTPVVHKSEVDQNSIECDQIIYNNGTLDELFNKLTMCLYC